MPQRVSADEDRVTRALETHEHRTAGDRAGDDAFRSARVAVDGEPSVGIGARRDAQEHSPRQSRTWSVGDGPLLEAVMP